MAKQFSRTVSAAQLNTTLATRELDDEVLAQPDTVQITAWLSRLHLLYGVPFNYIVPDIRMLPDESIRFFQVDENWITALIDGAFSPGTTIASSVLTDVMRPQVQAYVSENLFSVRAAMLNEEQGDPAPAALSGFLLRSSAVSGWPGMEITGRDIAQNELTILRMERISPSLLLCIFNGVIATVSISEPPEALHFGMEEAPHAVGTEATSYSKSLRYVNNGSGVQAGADAASSVAVTVLSNRTVKINELANSMATHVWAPGTPAPLPAFTSAEFALVMVQNTHFINFRINS